MTRTEEGKPITSVAGPVVYPFVGRARELSALATAASEARAGRGWTVVVAGEQGSGKSRLLETFVDRSRRDGATVLHARAFDADGTPPFWAWRTTLEAMVSGPDPALDRSDARALLRRLSRSTDDAGAPASRHALFHRLAQLFAAAAANARPLVIAHDDLHWADRASL
jgi:predicted ATPase